MNMTTKDLRRKLKIPQLPANGSRQELEDRYNNFRKETLAEAGSSSSDEENEETAEEEAQGGE